MEPEDSSLCSQELLLFLSVSNCVYLKSIQIKIIYDYGVDFATLHFQ
jgi:hypothetical protein